MSLGILTLVHVLISLAAIGTGCAVLGGMLAGTLKPRGTGTFLTTTTVTSVTGFFFPFHGFTPAIAVGVISLVVLALAIYPLIAKRLTGKWASIYVISSLIALYLNVFVLVAQMFQKIPVIRSLAPTQQEPPFAIVQTAVLLTFVILGWRALRNTRHAIMAQNV